MLERVPDDLLGWKLHPKWMTLGQLALHVATIPGDLSRLAHLDEFDASNLNLEPPDPESGNGTCAALEKSLDDATE